MHTCASHLDKMHTCAMPRLNTARLDSYISCMVAIEIEYCITSSLYAREVVVYGRISKAIDDDTTILLPGLIMTKSP